MKLNFKKMFAILLSIMLIVCALPNSLVMAESTGNVAKIGDTEYATLADALEAAQEGDTIVLLQDIESPTYGYEGGLNIKKAITLDLGGNTITDGWIRTTKNVTVQNGKLVNTTQSNPLVARSSSTLTVTNVQIEDSKSQYAIDVQENCSLIFNNSSVVLTGSTRDIYAIKCGTNSSITINSGEITVTATGKRAYGILGNYDNAKVTVNGGKITTSGSGYNHAIYTYGNITVNGGEIVTGTDGNSMYNYALYSKSDITVTGGSITTNGKLGYAVYAQGTDQTVTITGGEFESTTETNLIKAGSSTKLTANIEGGEFTGYNETLLNSGSSQSSVNVSGGTFDALNESYIEEGATVTVAGKTYTKTEGEMVEVPYVAEVNGTKYENIQEAIKAAKDGDTVQIFAGEFTAINISNKNITIKGTVGENGELLTTIKGGDPAITGHGFNGTIKDLKIVDAWKVMYAEPAGNITVDNVYVTGATYGFHLVAYSENLTWTIKNSYMDLSWANSFGVYGGGDAEIIITGNEFASTNPYYPDYGALAVNSFLPNVTVTENIFRENAKICIDASITDTSKINVSKNYHADGIGNAFADDTGAKVDINEYYKNVDEDGNLIDLVIIPTGLRGSGTEADPYQISSLDDLILFRDSVNAGETKYNASGVYVVLTTDIDLSSVDNWAPIGTFDYSFDGNFNGNGHVIKNLKMSDNTAANGEAYLGFFGVTANNVIENFVIENVTINTNGQIVAAAIAYPYYTEVRNITVCGDIAIKGGNYTAGVLAYTRLCQKASNLTVNGNAGSYITGERVVGGVIADIQMNKGLKADYSNFSAANVTITGTTCVGGISGIIATQAIDGVKVENVTLVCNDNRVGMVSGSFGGPSTITNVTTSNVTGATAIIGGAYEGAKEVQVKIGEKYYLTLNDALAAAKEGDVIKLCTDIYEPATMLVLPVGVSLDLQSHKLTVAYLVGFKGSHILGDTYKNDGSAYGQLVVAKDRVILSSEAYEDEVEAGVFRYVLPVWDSNDNCFVFGRYIVNETGGNRGFVIDEANNELRLQFKHKGSGTLTNTFFANGTSDNAVTFLVRISWISEHGDEIVQDYRYGDDMVILGVGDYDFGITFQGYQECTNITVTAMLVSSTGVTVAGTTHTVNAQN